MEGPLAPGYAAAFAEARSCLAALADASFFEDSVSYEHVLLDLDATSGVLLPATCPVAGHPPELRARVGALLEDLQELGGDPLSLELMLARLAEIGPVCMGGNPT